MQISDEMVERAARAIDPYAWSTRGEYIRRQISIFNARTALEAALSAAEPPVAVKALDAVSSDLLLYNLVTEAVNEGFSKATDPDWTSKDFTKSASYQAIRSALTAQVQDVAGTVEAFDKAHPELYWHIAKGKVTAGEPLYGAIIADLRGKELGHGESDVSAVDAFNIAVSAAAAPARHEG